MGTQKETVILGWVRSKRLNLCELESDPNFYIIFTVKLIFASILEKLITTQLIKYILGYKIFITKFIHEQLITKEYDSIGASFVLKI